MPVLKKRRSERRELHRLDHPARAVSFVVVTVLVAGAAFGAGLLVRSPNADVQEASQVEIPVYSPVEERAVNTTLRLQSQVSGATTQAIEVDPPDGVRDAVVTSVSAQVGPLPRVAFLGTVSDRPIFIASLDIPLYRDLGSGAKGSDVSSFQAALGVRQSGTMDEATLNAVRRLYKDSKTEPPGGVKAPVVTSAEFHSVPVADGGLSLADIAAIGTVLQAQTPFASVRYGAPFVTVRASVQEVEGLNPGDPVSVQGAGSAPEEAALGSIGEFQREATDDGRPPGRDVTVPLSADSKLQSGEIVSVTFGETSALTLAVPTVAIRSDSGGSYVLRDSDGPDERVNVIVEKTSDGWSAVSEGPLAVGDSIRVSG